MIIFRIIPKTFWFGQFHGKRKMIQIEESNANIATAKLKNAELDQLLSSPRHRDETKKIKHFRYDTYLRYLSLSLILIALHGLALTGQNTPEQEILEVGEVNIIGATHTDPNALKVVAGMLVLNSPNTQAVVGIEINANHMRAAKEGKVTGRVEPVRIGRTIQVWRIMIRDNRDRQICESRLTTMVINQKK